jgi:aminoglycoside phosphotransferase (APT) family kinase protein
MERRNGSWPMIAVHAASARLGILSDSVRVLRIGHCAVVALDDEGLVARVGRPGRDAHQLDAEMRFARYVASNDLPVLAPADHISPRAIETDDGAVAFWPLLRPVHDRFAWPWLAGTLRKLHGLPVPKDLISLWHPVDRVEQRLRTYAHRSDARKDYVEILWAACLRARRDLMALSTALGVGLLHGDPLNVIVAAGGPILIDFDLAGVGPAEWDLATVAVGHRRFGRRAEGLEQFYSAYGFKGSCSPSFETLVQVRELLDCSFALALVDTEPAAAGQLDVRMQAWLEPGDRSQWTALPLSPGKS